jgi:hypothetical protein
MINGSTLYQPDMKAECRICGTSPCVVVYDPELRHNSDTDMCGPCFFQDRIMLDWELWNEPLEATE